MKRQITIYESSKNGKITVLNDVECGTLGELKEILRSKDIDYTNKEFVEGVTNTKLLSDDSQIPTNIPFKGKTTNDVFINILNKDTKIKSGVLFEELSRTELLKAAKPYAKDIEDTYGANYTRVKSSDIIEFLRNEDMKVSKKTVAGKNENKRPINLDEKLEMLKEAALFLANELECDIEDMFENWEGKPVKEEEAEKSNFSMDDIQSFLRK